MKAKTSYAQQLHTEQTQLLYASIPQAIVGALANALILVVLLYSEVDTKILFSWLVLLFSVSALRGGTAIAYRNTAQTKYQDPKWARWLLFGTASSSATWGLASILLFIPDNIQYQTFLAFVIAGISAGAVSTLSYHRTHIILFLTCTLVPLSFHFFLEKSEMSLAMGFMCLFFLILVLNSAQQIYRQTEQNIRLTAEARNHEKELSESEERYRTIFDYSPVGIILYDADGKILDCNHTLSEMINCSKDQLTGTNLMCNIPDKEFSKSVADSLNGETSQFEGKSSSIIIDSETPIRSIFRGIQSTNQYMMNGICVVEDMTEHQRIESLKNEFISTVSHELRTPLTAIQGALKLICGIQLPDSKKDELLELAGRNSDRLLYLINDLLDFNKFTMGKMSFEFTPTDIIGFVEQAAASNASLASQYKVKFELDIKCGDTMVLADSNRLLQAISNLLSNAAKFSPEHSVIRIVVENINSMIRISIIDRGPGIPDDFQEVMYHKFTQHNSTDTRKVGGTGLGLSITKAIVENHNGVIGHFNNPDGGTTFYIEFPQYTAQGLSHSKNATRRAI